MAYAFPFWLAQFLFPVSAGVPALPEEREPLKIEVERLPDYQWRDLGFAQPARIRRE